MTREERTQAYRSLVTGVQDLQAEWPDLLLSEGRINDLCGFLFATLPLAEAALEEDDKLDPAAQAAEARRLEEESAKELLRLSAIERWKLQEQHRSGCLCKLLVVGWSKYAHAKDKTGILPDHLPGCPLLGTLKEK